MENTKEVKMHNNHKETMTEAKERVMKEIRCAFTEDQLKLVEIIAEGKGLSLEEFVVSVVMARVTGNDPAKIIEELRKEAAMWKDDAESSMEELASAQAELQRARAEIERLKEEIKKDE